MMPPLPADPVPAAEFYPAVPERRLVVAASGVVSDSPSSASPEHSDLSGTSALRPVRRRAALLAGAGLAVLLLAGGAFALTGKDDRGPAATTPAALSTAVTTAPDERPVKNADPTTAATTEVPTSPTPSPSARSSASATAVPLLTVGHGTRPHTATPGDEHTGGDSPAPALSAVYHYDDARNEGSVQVVNGGDGVAAKWTVTLSVPGGEKVSLVSGAVELFQSGASVRFRPTGGAVAAGGSVSFGFSLAGAPTSPPGGCAIDGVACS